MLTPVELARLVVLNAFHHLADGLGALRCALPDPLFAVPLGAGSADDLILLPQGFLQSGEECLVITGHDRVHARLRSRRESADIAFVVGLQLGELRFALENLALAARKSLGTQALLVVYDVLNDLESFRSFHGL